MDKQSHGKFLDLSAEVKPLIHRLGITKPTILTFIAARSGEGTSTVARSFARAFNAETGKKILLIDADGDEAVQTSGIVESVVSGADLAEALTDTGFGFFVGRWTAGAQGKNASGQVIQDKTFWKELSTNFDVVIIDAPALQASADGIAFAQVSHRCVLVVEAEATRKEVLENLRDTLTSANARIAGVVMNKRKFYIPEQLYKRL
jgi:Mrp family chromosome partitioning ATPase